MSFARCPNRTGSVRSSASGGYYGGYVVAYDPTTRIVADMLDLVVKAKVRLSVLRVARMPTLATINRRWGGYSTFCGLDPPPQGASSDSGQKVSRRSKKDR